MKDDRINSAGLLTAAAQHGYAVSERSLELWRYRGLLPRGERQPKGRAVWLYPPEAERHLLRLLHWREKTRSLDLIRIALWAEGFQIELGSVRESLIAFIDSWTQSLTRELNAASHNDDLTVTIEAIAAKLAAKRGKAAIPRVARMTLDERTRAIAYALAFAFDAEDEIERRKDDSVLLERMLGLRSGHGGGLATLMPLDTESLGPLRLPTPEQLRSVLDTAPEEELEFVRRIVQAIPVCLPMLLPMLEATFGAKASPVVEVVRKLFDDLHPGYYCFTVTAFLVSLHAKGHAVDELRSQLAGMTPEAFTRDLLASLPADQHAQAIEQLPL